MTVFHILKKKTIKQNSYLLSTSVIRLHEGEYKEIIYMCNIGLIFSVPADRQISDKHSIEIYIHKYGTQNFAELDPSFSTFSTKLTNMSVHKQKCSQRCEPLNAHSLNIATGMKNTFLQHLQDQTQEAN